METTLLIARLLLAVVFALAGVAKLADRTGSRQAVIDFGLPTALGRPLGLALPLWELAVAIALIPTSSAWWGALGALTLLVLFIAAISVNLARGRKPDCHCFGQLHSTPAGGSTLIRNALLAAVAGLVVWEGREGDGLSVLSWIGTLSSVELLVCIGALLAIGVVGAQWWFLLHLLRQNGRLLVRLEGLEQSLTSSAAVPSHNGTQAQAGLPVGSKAPTFSLKGLYEEILTLESLLAPGKPVMLIFTDPSCGPCNTLLPQIGRWQQEHSEKLTFALIGRGEPEDNRTKTSEHGVQQVLLQEDWEVASSYKISDTPSAVLIQPDGTIGSNVVAGPEGISSVVAHLVKPQIPIAVSKRIGDSAPLIKLENLSGEEVELEDFRGERTLVLFWNPECGFCQQMLPELKAWEKNPPKEAPKLLVVSAGTVEANEAMGLSSVVTLDQQFALGKAFGASGTPSAVVVDEEGKIASEVAVGAPAVLKLAKASQAKS